MRLKSGVPTIKACAAAVLLALAALCPSQVPPVTEAPPLIHFNDWREVSRPVGSIEYLATFPSSITTKYPENNTVPLRVFLPDDAEGAIPVVLVLHYLGASDLRGEIALALELNDRGIGAAIMTLPYHMARTPAGARSGELAIVPDPASLRETMTQAVLDARRSIDFLGSRPEFRRQPLGVVGTSLGAMVASLTYAVDPRVTHVAFVLGGVDLAHILWTSSLVVSQREVLRRHGYSEAKLKDELESVEPLTYLPNRAPGSSLVIAGKYDTVVPRRSTDELIDALKDPKVLWIDTGHYGGIFVQRRLLREVAEYFATEFNGRGFVAPSSLYAPTVRVGVKADTTGLDIAAGLDLFHFKGPAEGFGSLLLTPRGPQVFIGEKLTQALAIGATITFQRAGVGIFWSTVL